MTAPADRDPQPPDQPQAPPFTAAAAERPGRGIITGNTLATTI